jgi:hypothetical protein
MSFKRVKKTRQDLTDRQRANRVVDMGSPQAAIVAVIMVCAAPALSQEQGVVRITPRLGAGQALTAEIQNLSKLTLQLSGTGLRFGAAGADGSCTIELPADVTIAPAATETVKLAENETVRTCLQRVRGGAPAQSVSPFVLSERQLRQPELRAAVPDQAQLQEVAVSFRITAGKQPPASISTTWHLPVQ